MHARAVVTLTIAALLMASFAAAAASQAEASPVAETAKAKKKKKKRKKARRPAATTPAPGSIDPGSTTPPGPPDPPDPPDPPPPPPLCEGDDSAEEDDYEGSATQLDYWATTSLSRFSCPDDADYFRVTVPAGGYYLVDIVPTGETPWDAVLEANDEIGRSEYSDVNGPGGGESIAINNSDEPEAVVVHIKVIGKTVDDTGPYEFQARET
jgi:hypothetical protein